MITPDAFCYRCGGPLPPDTAALGECWTCIAQRGARRASANIRPTKRGDR